LLRTSIFQFAPKWLDIKHNLQEIATACQNISESTDLLLLPEMFNAAYVLDPALLSPQWQEETLSELKSLASLHHIAIGGSIPFFEEHKWYNRFILVEPDGNIQSYDKIQLFAPAGEKNVYQSGHTVKTFLFKNWNIQPLICYDLRFPYLSFPDQSPDLLIYAANWPQTRVHHWKSLLIARAIENQCYVIGVNRTGSDENGFVYPGVSIVVDYNGVVVSEMNDQSGMCTISLDLEAMQQFRAKLPFAADRLKGFMNIK
jgi:predicted amidohydrolase